MDATRAESKLLPLRLVIRVNPWWDAHINLRGQVIVQFPRNLSPQLLVLLRDLGLVLYLAVDDVGDRVAPESQHQREKYGHNE